MKLKGLGGMLTRCVVGAAAVGLLLLLLNAAAFAVLVISTQRPDNVAEDRIRTIAEGVRSGADGGFTISPEARTALDERYAWAMQLDEAGQVIWEDRMPEGLPRAYSVPDAVAFSHWYLNDYPVYCWCNDAGLMVLASPPGSEWKYNATMRTTTVEAITGWIPVVIALNLLAAFALALLIGLFLYRAAAPVAEGLDHLAQGGTVELSEQGVLRSLRANLNRTSATLSAQREALQKRDRTRTEWIAGVSHDIRTPLSLVQGSAAQLETEEGLSEEVRRKAALIRTQSQRIGRLVSDLNLASKLEYELQPLNITEFRPAALLRSIAVDALNACEDERIMLDIEIPPSLASLTVTGDEALIRRAVENLLRNSVVHNAGSLHVVLSLEADNTSWTVSVSDDGIGLSEEQLSSLGHDKPEGIPSHGLGLVLVRQIVCAHRGTLSYQNTVPGLYISMKFTNGNS